MTENKQMTQEEQQAWVREQYLKATKYLADKGLVTESVSESESRYLVPFIAVWQINLLDKTKVWVMSGDVPTDHLVFEEEQTARQVVRHFSFKWQLDADKLLKLESKEEKEFAQVLISRAEGLYQLFQDDKIWVEQK